MISPRNLLRLLPALVALLLLCAPAGAHSGNFDGRLKATIEDAGKIVTLGGSAKSEKQHSPAVTASLDVDDDAQPGPASRARGAEVIIAGLAYSAAPWIGYRTTAPPSWLRATPPTGPPHD